MKKRKTYDDNFIARVALEAIKGERTISECRQSIGKYIQKYNQDRLHQSLNEYDTPFEAYLQTKLAVAC